MLDSSEGLEHRRVTYAPVEGFWDEALLAPGRPRRHWRKLSVAISRMGLGELERRWHSGQQLIRANGITYNVYGDPKGRERPWQMDPVPLAISGAEWMSIEAAIAQRASLLNTILGDLYGPQTLIRQRHLPAALALASPHFLRPCVGIRPNRGVWLQNYAADLARSPDGRWWVIADRTQAPSGLGYAVENRLVSARTLPSLFSQCRVRQLTRFLEVQREAMLGLASARRWDPRVVLLTPGPNNETYFEHSFLAKHWGFPLVEGADLTVRDDRVYLKTLDGLQPVDYILRRQDDSFCDPLELRGDSLLGLPGLTRAARAANVVIGNALGSGLVESAAFAAFLPGLCRLLRDEELMMPSVATWWCGQDAPLSYVLHHLDQLVIKQTFGRGGATPGFPANMTSAERENLARRIEERPEEYTAQEQVALSTAPVRIQEGLAPRHIVLRVFAAWDGSSWSVLPGGLTRVSTEAKSLVVSMQLGGGSKDTWVIDDATDSPLAPRYSQLSLETPRGVVESPSRIGDNLYWFGRYAERVEASVRHVRSLLPSLSGEEDFGRTATMQTASHLLCALGYTSNDFLNTAIAEQRWRLLTLFSSMVYDATRTSSIGWNLREMRRVVVPLRERLSEDTWRMLQQLDAEFSRPAPFDPERRLGAQMELLDRAITYLSALSGLIAENTTRGLGWRFLEIGRRLERALQTADLLRAALPPGNIGQDNYLETLLQIADSTITYRTRYLSTLRTDNVLQLLMADESNPRSLAFQIAALRRQIGHLPLHRQRSNAISYELLVEAIVREMRMVRIDDLVERNSEGNAEALEDFLRRIKGLLFDVSDSLTSYYFNHLTPSRLSPPA